MSFLNHPKPVQVTEQTELSSFDEQVLGGINQQSAEQAFQFCLAFKLNLCLQSLVCLPLASQVN